MTQQAIASFLALGGNEIVNAARLKAYVDHGITPNKYSVRTSGCDGLVGILPVVASPVPDCGYQLPEIDDAPWYDVNVPESKDFAGILVTGVTVSAPYSRTATPNIGEGQVLGRQKLNGRTVVVTGWLIGRTCCATAYGLSWLSSVLGDPVCGGSGCTGVDMDFLACCPSMCAGEECLQTCDGDDTDCAEAIYIRDNEESEWQRGADFWRQFKGAGVVDGPNVLDCHGTSCGCGCGALIQVEFTLATSKPYIYHIADKIITNMAVPVCPVDACDECDINWVLGCSDPCADETFCTDDPMCPFPPLPPSPSLTVAADQCGCISVCTSSLVVPIIGERKWGSGVLNIDVAAGSAPMRNLRIYLFNNPDDIDCVTLTEENCGAFSTTLIDYIPTGGTLHFDGVNRRITVECSDGTTRDAGRNVTDVFGALFSWPEIRCGNVCIKFVFDCNHMSSDATISVAQVDRDL